MKKRGREKVEEKVNKDRGEGEERAKAITQNGNNIYPINHEPYWMNEPETTKRVWSDGACFMFETDISLPNAFSTTLCTSSLPFTSSTMPIRPSRLPESDLDKLQLY